MAYETETKQKVSPFQRVAQGIQGAMQGVDWAQQLQVTKAKMAELDQQRQLAAQQMQMGQLKGREYANGKLGDMMFDLARMPNGDALLDTPQTQSKLEGYGQLLQKPVDIEGMKAQVKAMNKAFGQAGGPLDTIDHFKSSLSVGDVTPAGVKQAEKNYKDALGALDQLAPYTDSDVVATKRNNIETAWADYQKNVTSIKGSELRLEGVLAAGATKAATGDETKIQKNLNDFYTQNKDTINALKQNNIEQALLSGDKDTVNNARLELAKNVSIISTVGKTERITEQMINRISLNPSIWNTLKRYKDRTISNVASGNDVEAQLAIAKLIQEARRKQLSQAVTGFSKSRKGLGTTEQDFYTRLSQENGLAEAQPSPAASATPEQSNGPKMGDIVDGYEFLGGDPADQKSWKKK